MDRVALNDIDDDYTPCPKCGSDDREWETCWHCHGEGGFHDCGEDCCACVDPENDLNEPCNECRGAGGYLVCHGCIAKAKATSPNQRSPR